MIISTTVLIFLYFVKRDLFYPMLIISLICKCSGVNAAESSFQKGYISTTTIASSFSRCVNHTYKKNGAIIVVNGPMLTTTSGMSTELIGEYCGCLIDYYRQVYDVNDSIQDAKRKTSVINEYCMAQAKKKVSYLPFIRETKCMLNLSSECNHKRASIQADKATQCYKNFRCKSLNMPTSELVGFFELEES